MAYVEEVIKELGEAAIHVQTRLRRERAVGDRHAKSRAPYLSCRNQFAYVTHPPTYM